MLGAGFVIGFLVTVAEPDVQVLATQVSGVDASISPVALVLMIAVGVGLFVAIAHGARPAADSPQAAAHGLLSSGVRLRGPDQPRLSRHRL